MSEVPLYYRGTSTIRKRTPLGPYRRPMRRVLGGGRFLMGEVPCRERRGRSLAVNAAAPPPSPSRAFPLPLEKRSSIKNNLGLGSRFEG